jgi:hypothetical protein
MAGNGKVSMNQVMDIFNAAKDSDRARVEPVWVEIVVDGAAERDLVVAIRDAFLPEHATAEVRVRRLDDGDVPSYWHPDLCVIVAGGSDEAVQRTAAARARESVPVAIVAESVLDAPTHGLAEVTSGSVGVVISSGDYEGMLKDLATWIIGASDKTFALAANFPFCRRAKVHQLVQAYASKNAAVGAMGTRGSGSDLYVMTSNQAKLALDIAAAYGRPLTIERAQELAGVVSAGVGYREVARAASGIIPGLDWALKAGVGYLGTMTTANAVASHFERVDAGAKALPRVRAFLGTVASMVPGIASGGAHPTERPLLPDQDEEPLS